jgi:hypothetical protein
MSQDARPIDLLPTINDADLAQVCGGQGIPKFGPQVPRNGYEAMDQMKKQTEGIRQYDRMRKEQQDSSSTGGGIRCKNPMTRDEYPECNSVAY